MSPKPPSRGRGTALAVEGVFLGIDLLNFILHAYSFSLTFVRQLPRGGSLSLNPTFRLQKHYKSVVGGSFTVGMHRQANSGGMHRQANSGIATSNLKLHTPIA